MTACKHVLNEFTHMCIASQNIQCMRQREVVYFLSEVNFTIT